MTPTTPGDGAAGATTSDAPTGPTDLGVGDPGPTPAVVGSAGTTTPTTVVAAAPGIATYNDLRLTLPRGIVPTA